MPEHFTEERNGHLRTTVKLPCGGRVGLCRCFKSKEFPFCDGTHRTLEGKEGPVIVEMAEKEQAIDEEKSSS